MFACSRRFWEGGLAQRFMKSVGGVERGFTVVVCRACPDPPCMKTCVTNALTLRKEGGTILDLSKYIGCRRCIDACTFGAVFWMRRRISLVEETFTLDVVLKSLKIVGFNPGVTEGWNRSLKNLW